MKFARWQHVREGSAPSTALQMGLQKRAPPQEKPKPQQAAANSVQAAVNSLQEQCVTMKIDYWDYEVCLGSGVKQFHQPDSYPLGLCRPGCSRQR